MYSWKWNHDSNNNYHLKVIIFMSLITDFLHCIMCVYVISVPKSSRIMYTPFQMTSICVLPLYPDASLLQFLYHRGQYGSSQWLGQYLPTDKTQMLSSSSSSSSSSLTISVHHHQCEFIFCQTICRQYSKLILRGHFLLVFRWPSEVGSAHAHAYTHTKLFKSQQSMQYDCSWSRNI